MQVESRLSVQSKNSLLDFIQKTRRKIRSRTAVLGGGDIGFPLIFTGTVLFSVGLERALIVTMFSTLSLFILLILSKKDRFYPAMPFLTTGCLVGFAIAKII